MRNPLFSKKRRIKKRLKRAGGVTEYVVRILGHQNARAVDCMMGFEVYGTIPRGTGRAEGGSK
jgi:hypothetical protein